METSGPGPLNPAAPTAENNGTPSPANAGEAEAKQEDVHTSDASLQQPEPHSEPVPHSSRPFEPLEALKLGSLRLASLIRRDPRQLQQQPQQSALHNVDEVEEVGQQHGSQEVVARIRATAAGFGARAKEQGSRFYQASLKTAAATAEGIKRLAQGEPLQVICRSELAMHPCPQLVLVCCTAIASGPGLTTERIFKHDPPQELVDRLARTAAGPLRLLPPGASPHAVASLLKRFLLGLPEPLLTYRLLPQWVAAGDHPEASAALLQQLPPANAGALSLIIQTCSLINEQAAVNEMDSQALAEVLAHVVAWKPAPRSERSAAPGPWQNITKALALNRPTPATGDAAGADAAEDDAEKKVVGTAAHMPEQESAGSAEAHKVTPLDDAELDAIVTVLEYMISNYSTVATI